MCIEHTDKLLRTLGNKLFAFAGVDWRGRPLSGALPPPMTTAQPDPVYAAIEASRQALDEHISACNAADADTVEGDARRTAAGTAAYQTWRALLATTPTTAVGAQALALRAIDQLERDGCWNDSDKEVDARTLFRAIAAAGTSDDGAPTARAEAGPVIAAHSFDAGEDAELLEAVAELVRLDREIDVLVSSKEIADWLGTAEGRALDTRRSKALRTLIKVKASTRAGLAAKARALCTPALIDDYVRHGGLAVSLAQDIRNAGEPIPADSKAYRPSRARKAAKPVLIAAE